MPAAGPVNGMATNDVLAGKRILVVDDQSTPRMLVASSLEHCGVHVLQAEDAERALEIAGSAPVDAFILDINMPGMSGIELCRSLRALPRLRNAPMIFVTGMAPAEMLQWALDAGGDDFIRKPVQSVVLRTRLRSLFERAAHVGELELLSLSLRRYLSPRTEEMARAYAATGVLAPPRREQICVLFADARGLTDSNEELAPEETVRILSGHFARQIDAVQRHEGYVEKFHTDGLLAVFTGAERILRCCLCALDVSNAVPGAALTGLGIGIHAGSALIGNLGSSERLDYSFIGRTVSLAARLSSLSDRSAIVVSNSVRDGAATDPRLAFANERRAVVRGYSEPVAVFDLSRGGSAGSQ